MISLNWSVETKSKEGYQSTSTDSTTSVPENPKPLPFLIYLNFDLKEFINIFYKYVNFFF